MSASETANSNDDKNLEEDGRLGLTAEISPTAAPVNSAIEHGGPKGLEPTRYGDWEKNGRCIDF